MRGLGEGEVVPGAHRCGDALRLPPRLLGEAGRAGVGQAEGASAQRRARGRVRVGIVPGRHALKLIASRRNARLGPVSIAGVDRSLMGRRIRRLRGRLGLSQEAFGERYGIPVANIRQYEIGRHMPPPAVRAYLKVIDAEPEIAARALAAA